MNHDRTKLKLYIEQKGLCAGCNLVMDNPKDVTIDHIHPKWAGGANMKANYQLMHQKCNSFKGGRLTENTKLIER